MSLQIFNYKYKNNGLNTVPATISFSTPPRLKNNLKQQKIGIKFMKINNDYLPNFIPEICQPSLFNTDFNSDNVTMLNDTYSINSLNYYICLRKKDNSELFVNFIQHQSQDATINPPSTIPNDEQLVLNRYYWYPFFNRFVHILKNAISDLITASGASEDYIQFVENGTHSSLYLDDELTQNYFIEFSANLMQLLPFPNVQSSYCASSKVIWNWLPSASDANIVIVTCKYCDNIIPYDSLILQIDETKCNVPLETEVFINSTSQSFQRIL